MLPATAPGLSCSDSTVPAKCLKISSIRREGANVKTQPLAQAQHVAASKFSFDRKSWAKKLVAALAVGCPAQWRVEALSEFFPEAVGQLACLFWGAGKAMQGGGEVFQLIPFPSVLMSPY